jgi:hypothetical protein
VSGSGGKWWQCRHHCMRLTSICSGGGGGLWKGSQHSGGSSSGGIRRSGAVLELHTHVLVGLWRCVLRHGGGECEGGESLCSLNRPIPLNKD